MLGIEIAGEAVALGALTGLGYGLVAVGLVMTFRASRAINLAHGQIGAFGAVLLAVMVQRWDVPYWVALPAALGAGALVAWVVEAAIVRRLASAPDVMTLIATLGAAQVLAYAIAAIAVTLPPGELFPQPPGLPSADLGALRITPSLFGLLILGPPLIGTIVWVLRSTALGLSFQASAANAPAARLLGVRAPRLTGGVWAVAGALAVFTAIMVLPAGGSPAADALGPSLLLRALGAAALARFASVPGALAAGVGIGVVESVVQWNHPRGDLTDMLLFAVLALSLGLARGGALGARGREPWTAVSRLSRLPAEARAVPAVRWAGWVAGTLALGLAAALPALAHAGQEVRGTTVVVLALAALSVWVVTGLGGQLTLGQFAIAGVGALVVARVALASGSVLVGFLAAPVAGAALGAVLALPGLRRGTNALAVVTLGFALAADSWLFVRPWAYGSPRHVAPLDLGVTTVDSPAAAYWLALAVFAGCLLAARALARSRHGRRMVAVRDNEVAARVLGVAPARVRVLGMAVGGAIAALAGALLTQAYFDISSASFDVLGNLQAVAVAAVGGLASPVGAPIGALYVVGLPSFVDLSGVALSATALGWLILIVQAPGGLAQVLAPARLGAVRLLLRASGRDPGLALRPPAPKALPTGRLGAAARGRRPAELRLQGVAKRYGPVTALGGVDVALAPGECVAVVGPNGAGKTTLLDVASGLTPADMGEVRLDGEDLSGLRPEARARRGLGRSLQEGVLFPTLTVRETVGVAADSAGAPPGRAEELAGLLGLGTVLEDEIRTLSTGMRRVVELAAVLALDSRVLLLDEPSAGLAQAERAALVDVLRGLRAELGTSILLVEHDMVVVAGVADRVVVLDAGLVTQEGTPETVLGPGGARA